MNKIRGERLSLNLTKKTKIYFIFANRPIPDKRMPPINESYR